MEQRGRKSLENQTVVALVPGKLPDAPEGLNAAEKAVWDSVVATKPANWFTPDIYPLLADYCTACVQQESVRRQLQTEECDKEKTLRLLDMLGKLKMALATKMRMTPQSRYQPSVAATAAKRVSGLRPWEE